MSHSPLSGTSRRSGRHAHQAIEILAGGDVPVDALVTHEYPLDQYRAALETAMDRASGSIKVVLRP